MIHLQRPFSRTIGTDRRGSTRLQHYQRQNGRTTGDSRTGYQNKKGIQEVICQNRVPSTCNQQMLSNGSENHSHIVCTPCFHTCDMHVPRPPASDITSLPFHTCTCTLHCLPAHRLTHAHRYMEQSRHSSETQTKRCIPIPITPCIEEKTTHLTGKGLFP